MRETLIVGIYMGPVGFEIILMRKGPAYGKDGFGLFLLFLFFMFDLAKLVIRINF
jgi:hypothetical protein